jgi:hypothetical protein
MSQEEKLSRSWQEIAEEITHEQNSDTLSQLVGELTKAFDRVHSHESSAPETVQRAPSQSSNTGSGKDDKLSA